MAWVGAIVVAIAGIFFAKLAIDRGWIGRMPPGVRCLLLSIFGVILITGGEWALRRIGRAAAVGLFGAGLAVLYTTAYATAGFFQLLPPAGGFLLMALVALLGFALTIHTRLLTIGVLSIMGGYLCPILSGGSGPLLALPLYLTMLLTICLGLSAVMPRPFRPLRYVALIGHGMLAFAWMISEGRDAPAVALVFASLWWAMILAESLWAALRRQSALGNVVISVLSTAWFVTVGCGILYGTGPRGDAWLGGFTLAVALAAAAIAATFGTGLDGIRGRFTTPIDKLATTLWGQCAVLLAVAVALQFDDYGMTIGWLAIAIVSIELGRRLEARWLDCFGLIVGALALARVLTLDAMNPALETPVFAINDAVRITGWSILALAALAAVHLASWRIRPAREWPWPALLASLEVLGWAALCWLQCGPLTATCGWLLGAIVLLAFHRQGWRQRYLELGATLLAVTAGKWLLFDALAPRLELGWHAEASLPLLNSQMGLALAIAAVGWWLGRIVLNRAAQARSEAAATLRPINPGAGWTLWQLCIVAVVTLVLIAASFEIDRIVMRAAAGAIAFGRPLGQARQLLLTILWTLGALVVQVLVMTAARHAAMRAVAPQARRPALLTGFAWTVLSICAIKWIAGDTLWWATREISGGRGGWIVANLQMIAGIVLAVTALLAWRWRGAERGAIKTRPRAPVADPAQWVPFAAGVIVLWGLSFEVDRAIAMLYESRQATNWTTPWPATQHRALWLTALWGAGGLVMMIIGRRRALAGLLAGGCGLLLLAAAVWLTFDSLAPRLAEGPALTTPVLNLQFMVGAALVIMALAATRLWNDAGTALAALRDAAIPTRMTLFAVAGIIGLWLGSLEIDRFFHPGAGRTLERVDMAKQTGLSIWWAVYAVFLIGLGFAKRIAWSRYAGMALFAITLVKVVLIDMAGVDAVYRVLSFVGLGLLLILTSIAYVKLAPRLLGEAQRDA